MTHDSKNELHNLVVQNLNIVRKYKINICIYSLNLLLLKMKDFDIFNDYVLIVERKCKCFFTTLFSVDENIISKYNVDATFKVATEHYFVR